MQNLTIYLSALIDKVKAIEPISRKLIRLGKLYLSVLSKSTEHLDINRYYYVLTLIYSHDGELTQNDLAKKLDKDKSSLVSIINLLTAKELVYRETNPADRREHLLRVTDKGKHAASQIARAFEALNKHMVKDISKEDMRIFNNVLVKMQDNLNPSFNALK